MYYYDFEHNKRYLHITSRLDDSDGALIFFLFIANWMLIFFGVSLSGTDCQRYGRVCLLTTLSGTNI